MLLAVLLGIVILAVIVVTGQSKDSDDSKPAPAPSMSAEATEEATAEATEESSASAANGEAPSRFIGNWKDSSKATLVLTWKAPAGDVTGYKVEISYNGGSWKEIAALPASALSQEVAKVSSSAYTSFRVSAIYGDGSVGTAKAFGFAGEFN